MGRHCDCGQPLIVELGFSACSKMHQMKTLNFSTLVKLFENLTLILVPELILSEYLIARAQVCWKRFRVASTVNCSEGTFVVWEPESPGGV